MLEVKAYKEENNGEVRCEFITHVKKDEFEGMLALMKAFGATVSIAAVDDFKPVKDITPDNIINNTPEMPDISTEVENVVNSTEKYANPVDTAENKSSEAVVPAPTKTTEITEAAEVVKDSMKEGESATTIAENNVEENSIAENTIEIAETASIETTPVPVTETAESIETPVTENPQTVHQVAQNTRTVTYKIMPKNTRIKSLDEVPVYQAAFLKTLEEMGITSIEEIGKSYKFEATEEQIKTLDAKYMRM